MLILNTIILKSFYGKKKKKNLQDIIVVQMYETMKIQMHYQSNYLIFWLICFINVYILEKSLRMKLVYFHLDKT
jgi:hypothetical protein